MPFFTWFQKWRTSCPIFVYVLSQWIWKRLIYLKRLKQLHSVALTQRLTEGSIKLLTMQDFKNSVMRVLWPKHLRIDVEKIMMIATLWKLLARYFVINFPQNQKRAIFRKASCKVAVQTFSELMSRAISSLLRSFPIQIFALTDPYLFSPFCRIWLRDGSLW